MDMPFLIGTFNYFHCLSLNSSQSLTLKANKKISKTKRLLIIKINYFSFMTLANKSKIFILNSKIHTAATLHIGKSQKDVVLELITLRNTTCPGGKNEVYSFCSRIITSKNERGPKAF